MNKKTTLTDEEVEREIGRLLEDPAVILAKFEERLRNRRRQYLYSLRTYKRHGEAMMAEGITADSLIAQYKEEEDDENKDDID